MVPTEKDCIYAAGFMDGEGTFTIGLQRNTHFAQVSVNNTDWSVISWFVNNFGAKGKPIRKYERHKQAYYARWNYDTMEPFVRAILPYLKVKRRQAEIVLLFLQNCTQKFTGVTKSNLTLRKQLFDEVRYLNRKGDVPN